MQKESYDTATTNLLFVDCETQGRPLTMLRIHPHNLKLCVVMDFLVQKPAGADDDHEPGGGHDPESPMATAVLQRTPLARGPAATRSTQPPVLFPLPPVVFPEPPSAATAQEASGVGGRGGRVLRRRVASGAIRSREKGGEKSSKASPDPDEKVLLISGAPAAPLPNTKLSPREAPQEPTDGEYSCWVKADVTGRRERSIPERRIGVKAAAGWSERKGVAWNHPINLQIRRPVTQGGWQQQSPSPWDCWAPNSP